MIRDITIGQYYPAKSVLHRLDPRVKLVGTLLYLISLFLLIIFGAYLVATVFLITIIRLSKVPFSYIMKGMKPIYYAFADNSAFQSFSYQRRRCTFSLPGFFTITEAGLRTAVFMAITVDIPDCRIFPYDILRQTA